MTTTAYLPRISWEPCPEYPVHHPSLLPPTHPSHWFSRDSLQTMALGPCEVHVAAQSTMKILQGILCHLYLPLCHKDVLARKKQLSGKLSSGYNPVFLMWSRSAPCGIKSPSQQDLPASDSILQATD